MGRGRLRRGKRNVISSDDDDDVLVNEDLPALDTDASTKPQTTTVEPARTIKSGSAVSTSSRKPASAVPTKTRQTRQTSKAASDAQPKRANKTLFSFFNAATQRQQVSSQESASPTRSATSTAHHEDIDDDDISGDDASITLSQNSQTAQILRKRKFQSHQIGEADGNGPLAASQKFRKVSDGNKVPAKPTTLAQDTRPWTERFAPVNLSELAVHPRKVSDVRNVLVSALSDRPRPRLIVLKGAAGTGKTATINLLAKEMSVEIMEWKSPVGSDISSAAFTSFSSQFEDFVLRSGKFTGLDLVRGDGTVQLSSNISNSEGALSGKQLMLVEEFPNTFAKGSPALQAFRNTIQQFLAAPVSSFAKSTPLVMVISEALLSTTTASADSFTAHRLLGPSILNHPQTAQIEFNNIAITILTKALDTIVVKEARKSGRRFTPGPGVLKRLAETGDIRSAVSSLEFLCLAGDDSNAWSSKVAFTKPKGRIEPPMTQKEQDALKLVSNRESSLGIFHAVGRVVHNKRIAPPTAVPQPPTYFPQHRKPKIPENDPNNLINEVGTDTATFIAALQENYALSCSSSSSEDAMDSLNGCIDALSDSDMLSFDRFGFGTKAFSGSAQDNIRQDDMSFQTAIRGLLFWLPSPVNRIAGLPRSAKRGDEFRMFYPSSLKLWKQKEEIEGTLESVVSMLHRQALGSDSTSVSNNHDGVASWQRRQVLTSEIPSAADGVDATDTGPPLSTALLGSTVKNETLLERLPYALQILSRRKGIPQPLLTGISNLVRVFDVGTSPVLLGNEEADTIEDAEIDPRQIEWTDHPDHDATGTKKGQRQQDSKQKDEFEGHGLQIPVEHAVERLVLSDDDIEDD